MTRYEYLNVPIPNEPIDLSEQMDEWGKSGWRVVNVSEPTPQGMRLVTFLRSKVRRARKKR